MKKEKIVILGHSGSGKDFLCRKLTDMGLVYHPKFTTRPKRSGETNGLEYDFITNKDYEDLVKNNQILTHQEFEINGSKWYYGLTKEIFSKSQIFIMTPHELKSLPEEISSNLFKVYLNIDENIRRKRLNIRNDINDLIDRRINADRIDFENFNNYDLMIRDSELDANIVYDLMKF